MSIKLINKTYHTVAICRLSSSLFAVVIKMKETKTKGKGKILVIT